MLTSSIVAMFVTSYKFGVLQSATSWNPAVTVAVHSGCLHECVTKKQEYPRPEMLLSLLFNLSYWKKIASFKKKKKVENMYFLQLHQMLGKNLNYDQGVNHLFSINSSFYLSSHRTWKVVSSR